MCENDEDKARLSTLPTEVLVHIFSMLPARELVLCRRVCRQWRDIVDNFLENERLWSQHCKRDYPKCYKEAAYKTRPNLSWYSIYRSLSLWSKLGSSKEIRNEFSHASIFPEKIKGCKVIAGDCIAVLKEEGVIFYNVLTLQLFATRGSIRNCQSYLENEHAIVIQDRNIQLQVTRKDLNPKYDPSMTVSRIAKSLLVDREVFYANVDHEVFVCKLDVEVLKGVLLGSAKHFIMTLSYTNTLNVLTYCKTVYKLKGRSLQQDCLLECVPNLNLLDLLYRYKFLDSMDWTVYKEWALMLSQPYPDGPIREILTMKVYGDIVLVGCNFGVVLIYYKPFTNNGQFDLLNSTPVKQYNYAQPSFCPLLAECPIKNIDVVEHKDGHSVFVAMPKKIGVITFKHSLSRVVM